MIKSARNVYVAGHVTRAVKTALRQEAKKQGISQSDYISQAIISKLEADGTDVTIQEALKEEDVRLPLEGTDERTHSDH